eukprot:15478595-Alexandrium_andersonii.AAC.1
MDAPTGIEAESMALVLSQQGGSSHSGPAARVHARHVSESTHEYLSCGHFFRFTARGQAGSAGFHYQ